MAASDSIFVPDLSLVAGGDALIIVPPFAGLRWPSLGVHLIQSCAALAGLDVRVLYANLLFAANFGEETYQALGCIVETTAELVGERLFAAAAYGCTPLALPQDGSDDERFADAVSRFGFRLTLQELHDLEAQARTWVEAVADAISALAVPIVGASTTFEQTSAAIALLSAVKRRRRETIAILGGGNCEGPMAEGILSIGAPIDYVFSGESEETFVEWMQAVGNGQAPADRIVRGRMQLHMDRLPVPDYRSWFAQRALFLGEKSTRQESNLFVTYETSRGCWWGAKHHCTFCGLNGLGMRYREKSADRVIDDLRCLAEQGPVRFVWLVDNIMPHHYFRTLLPRLQAEQSGIGLFYEVKANLSFEKMRLLKAAGVFAIQPGVEALSSGLLRLMDKGVTAAQNVSLLRHALSFGIKVVWNLLYRFPDDETEHYEQTLALMPLLRHLPPPQWVGPLRIDRFSPYHEQPERFGIRNLRPLPAYAAILPPGAAPELVAYTFVADFESACDRKSEARIWEAAGHWRESWSAGRTPPALHIFEARPDVYMLLDTRGLPGSRKLQRIDMAKARAALIGKVGCTASARQSAAMDWAISQQAAIWLDGEYAPLATAAPELIARLQDNDCEADSTDAHSARASGGVPAALTG
jgi:ribosomal peptide maturation radical SAM protein 1